MKPLRAFLFSKNQSDEWSSAAYRELETLLEGVSQALAVEGTSAAIHVGFWRPETTKVAELAQQWGGTLLLSDSAVGSLPPTVKVSHSSVGEVDGVSFRVALDGFGYQIEDPTPGQFRESKTIDSHIPSIQFQPRGWVEQLISEKPEYESLLQEKQIWDEESFHKNEYSLEINERLSLAFNRYRLIVGSKVSEINILDNLHACPDWFLNDDLHLLNLTVRMRNVCKAYGMNTIRDIAAKGYSGLLKLPNMGQGSVHGLGTILWKAFIEADALRRQKWDCITPSDSGTDRAQVAHEGITEELSETDPSKVPVIDGINSGFVEAAQALSFQERGIWATRLGYRCEQKTLQMIGDDIGLTRERVRQIEVKIYRKVGRHPFWTQLSERIKGHLNSRTSSLLLDGIGAVDPWFKDASELKEPLRQAFHHILHDEFSILNINETPVITRLTSSQWEKAIDAGKALLREMVDQRVSEDQARVQIGALLNDAGEELRDDLWAIVHPFAMWASSPGGQRIIVGYGRTAESVVLAILVSAGKPLHYREIYRRSKQFSGKAHEERALHNAAANVAVLYNRGTYGLLSHCPLTPKELALIEAEIEDIAAGSEPTKQWHTSELLDELLERGFDFDGKISKYIVNIALRNSKTFVNMRRMVWGYRESWQASTASRLDMRQAVMALLEEAGRPLSTLEIQERLKGDRGFNEYFQIHPQGNLIRLGTGLWGLADRDIKVKDPNALLQKLLKHLQQTKEGVHISEVTAVLGEIDEDDAQALLGLVNHKGMRRDRAQYVYLSEWEGSRRIWPGHAVEQALDTHPKGASIEKIRLEVNRLTKRNINPIYISHLLVHTDGAVYDAENELWYRELETVSESNDDGESD
jgi:hypothetical protein